MRTPTLLALGLVACGAPASDASPSPQAGEAAPDFTLVDDSGALVSLSDSDGAPRLVFGLAGW